MPTQYNLRSIRELVNAAYSLEELRNLCLDEFRPVYDNYGEEKKPALLRHLIEHCDRKAQFPRLLRRVRTDTPDKFAEAATHLWSGEPPDLGPAPVVAPPQPAREPAAADAQRLARPYQKPDAAEVTAGYGRSYALVIGINDYRGEHPTLLNARNDARAMAEALRDTFGFDEVTTLYDEQASHKAILGWLRDELRLKPGPNDRVLFFFAGHGTTAGREPYQMGYLIPSDAKRDRLADYIDMDEIKKACWNAQSKHILFILDCCFSGVAAVTGRAALPIPEAVRTDTYFKKLMEKGAWQVMTAGDKDELAADGSGSRPGHSAFTSALLDGLLNRAADPDGDGLITASDLYHYVRPVVTRTTAPKGQTPFFNYLNGSAQGDFIFLLPADAPPSTEPSTPPRPASPPAHSRGGDTFTLPQPLPIKFVYVPAGEFLMGRDPAQEPEALAHEQPQHLVKLPDFYIGRYPVTTAEFAAFVRATGSAAGPSWRAQTGPSEADRHPATNLSWPDAVAFCRWLSAESGHLVRLPTEAEWEKAARGVDGRPYPWGHLSPSSERCNFNNIIGNTTPVGAYAPQGNSPYGCADMAGNVWEWCSTRQQEPAYPFSVQDEWTAAYLAQPGERIVRGGAWDDDAPLIGCGVRRWHAPEVRLFYLGFRVVVEPRQNR